MAVKPSLWTRMETASRRMTPIVLTVLASLLTVVPARVPALQPVVPLWPMMMVFHWSLYRPDLMPVTAVLLVGLLHDALIGAPIGLNALVFVMIHGIVDSQRRFFTRKPFGIIWLGFAAVSAAGLASAWLLGSIWNRHVLSPDALVFQYLLTLGCFALVFRLMLGWQRVVLGQT